MMIFLDENNLANGLLRARVYERPLQQIVQVGRSRDRL